MALFDAVSHTHTHTHSCGSDLHLSATTAKISDVLLCNTPRATLDWSTVLSFFVSIFG